MPGNPFSLTNPSGEVHSNNHTTPWPNYLTTAYALMFYNDRAVRELMSQKYELLVRNAFNLYLYHLALLGGGPEMTFTNYVLNSLAEAGFFAPLEIATVDEIERKWDYNGWRVMNRLFIVESYTMRSSLAEFVPNSALQLEAAYALQSAAVLRSVLPPQSRSGSQQLQYPVHPGHMLMPSIPHQSQSSPQLPLPPVPSPLLPLPLTTPSCPARPRTNWSIENILSLNHTTEDESPAAEPRPEMPASPFTHRSADSPSDCFIVSAPEHFEPFPSSSFQQLTDRSYEPLPATSANSTRAEPSTSRSFQPTAAPSTERAGENSVGGSKNSKRERSNERTDVGTLDPPPMHSYEPPVTRSNQSSARSTARSPSLSTESAKATKYKTYPAPYFRPSIGSIYSQASSSGFVPPTAGGVDHDTSSGYQQSTTHSFLPPPTTSTELCTTFKNEASLVPSSEPRISSAFKPPATLSSERSTLCSVNLPVRCSEPPPAHIPIRWPIPDLLPMPPPVYTIKPLSTPLPPPTLSPLPPPTSSPMPSPTLSPMPPPLPMPTLTISPVYPSVHKTVHSQAHMPILRTNHVQMAAPPPEHIPLPPRRRRNETTGCPLCRSNTHK